jgi:hypothetical protein
MKVDMSIYEDLALLNPANPFPLAEVNDPLKVAVVVSFA